MRLSVRLNRLILLFESPKKNPWEIEIEKEVENRWIKVMETEKPIN